MKTRSIDTLHHDSVCDVCGRTLLRGENTEAFLSGGRRLEVCELCKPRALHEGWIREGTIPDYPNSGGEPTRRRGLFGRLRSRSGAGAQTPAQKRGRPSLDDELEGDGWNPHAPMHEPDFHQPSPDRRDRDEVPDRRERSGRGAAETRPGALRQTEAPPPRRPSRRGMPPHQPAWAATEPDFQDDAPDLAGPGAMHDERRVLPGEPRPLQFSTADDERPWDDPSFDVEPAATSEPRGGAIEAWESEPEDGWLVQPAEGEAEIFDTATDAPENPDRQSPERYPSERRAAERQPAERQAAERQAAERRSRFRRPRGERRGRPGEMEGGPGLSQPAQPRQVHAIPSDDVHRSAAAVNAFNESEHCRTIAGVARSLGAPVVNVTPDQTHAGSVWIVASWELCWYRYEVDISSARTSVRLDTQGYELSDLTEEQQTANAVAAASGQVTLARAQYS